jgi:Na+-translocating ferredoxin:NAD+ oxidoreductase RnfG subunit
MAFYNSNSIFPYCLLTGAIPWVAYSQVYLTEDQAAKTLFPNDQLVRKEFLLTAEEAKKIEENSGERVRNLSVVVWLSTGKNVMLLDQVLGKHDFITYCVGLTPNKTIRGIEILEYRETYGHEIRREEWRKQFQTKTATAPLRLNQDIVNISGATLSSSHVTAGVRRMLQTYEILHHRL